MISKIKLAWTLGKAVLFLGLAGTIWWQKSDRAAQQSWQNDVLLALGTATQYAKPCLDAPAGSTCLVIYPVKKRDALPAIAALGQFKIDVQIAREALVKADLVRKLDVTARQNSAKEDATNAYFQNREQIRSQAAALQNSVARQAVGNAGGNSNAVGLRDGRGLSAIIASGSGRGAAPVPRIPGNTASVDRTSTSVGLSDADTRGVGATTETAPEAAAGNAFSNEALTFTIEQRRIASEQAAQLDALISLLESLKIISTTPPE